MGTHGDVKSGVSELDARRVGSGERREKIGDLGAGRRVGGIVWEYYGRFLAIRRIESTTGRWRASCVMRSDGTTAGGVARCIVGSLVGR